MTIGDEVGGQTRWAVARRRSTTARKSIEGKSKDLEIKAYRFDTDLRDYKADDAKEPDGRETDLGSMLLKAVKDAQGVAGRLDRPALRRGLQRRDLAAGRRPAARGRSRSRSSRSGVGTADAGQGVEGHRRPRPRRRADGLRQEPARDPRARSRSGASPTSRSRSSCYVEGEPGPVATRTIKVPEGAEVVPITGLKYIPETPGEKRVTLRVKPQAGRAGRDQQRGQHLPRRPQGGPEGPLRPGAGLLLGAPVPDPEPRRRPRDPRRPQGRPRAGPGRAGPARRRRLRPGPVRRLHPRRPARPTT